MPPMPTVPGVIKVTWVLSLDEDTDIINLTHLAYHGGSPNSIGLDAMAASLGTSWGTNMAPHVTGAVTLQRIDTEDLASASGAVASTNIGTAGGLAGPQLPAAVAVNVQKRIARRYRGGKPKNFIVAGNNAMLFDHQSWTAAFASTVALAWLAVEHSQDGVMYSPITIDGPVSVSYFSGFTPVTNPTTGRVRNVPKLRVGGPVVDPVIGYHGQTKLGTQRRRNVR
jgi:hypothetical protein